MKECDIAIVGAGLAGATAAAMLGKAGHNVALVDPHSSHPPEFRCEKLDASQVELLRKTGLAEPVLREAAEDGTVAVVRYGRLVATKPSVRHGIIYDKLVNKDKTAEAAKRLGVLIASGFIVGESLFNVALAGIIVLTNKGEPLAVPFAPSEHIGMVLALIVAAITVFGLYNWARKAAAKTASV